MTICLHGQQEYKFSFGETLRKFIITIINLHCVSTNTYTKSRVEKTRLKPSVLTQG